MRQLCFTGLMPPKPTIRNRTVAERIARRITEAVNLDNFYWTPDEMADRVADVEEEIMRCVRPASVFDRLHRKSPPVSDRPGSERITHPYGWEGISEHCHAIADDIAAEELDTAIGEWSLLAEGGMSVTNQFHKENEMKKLVQVTEVEGEGLLSLMGQRVTFFALNYIYTGTLTGVNDTCVCLEDAAIVYETGPLLDETWKDAQKLPHPVYVMLACVESFMRLKE